MNVSDKKVSVSKDENSNSLKGVDGTYTNVAKSYFSTKYMS